jgi:DNA recombination-dependent growth factor C
VCFRLLTDSHKLLRCSSTETPFDLNGIISKKKSIILLKKKSRNNIRIDPSSLDKAIDFLGNLRNGLANLEASRNKIKISIGFLSTLLLSQQVVNPVGYPTAEDELGATISKARISPYAQEVLRRDRVILWMNPVP